MSDNYDFTYIFPKDFDVKLSQLLEQVLGKYRPVDGILRAFKQCKYEYYDKGLAYYAGMKEGDYWNKHALDFTITGLESDIEFLKTYKDKLKEAMDLSLDSSITGYVVRNIYFLKSDIIASDLFSPSTNNERLSMTLKAAKEFLQDLIRVCERLCNNSSYNNHISENAINDYIRDMLGMMGYNEAKDQTRHGISLTGKDAGVIDILITKDGEEVAIIEGLKLNSIDSNYIDKHIKKAIINYNGLGTATFICAYVSTSNFESFWSKYME